MFGWFSSKDTEKSIVNGLIDGVDAIVLTDEEKINYNQRKLDIILRGAEIKTEQLKLFEPYKLVQRFIALLVFIPFTLMIMSAFYFRLNGNDALADAIYRDIGDNTLTLVMMIATFYYSGSIITNIRGK